MIQEAWTMLFTKSEIEIKCRDVYLIFLLKNNIQYILEVMLHDVYIRINNPES